MRVLVTGHVVGQRAVDELSAVLPRLRRVHHLDLVLVNGDNCAITGPSPFTGSGMTPAQRDQLLAAGADLLLTGTHVWDGGHGAQTVRHARVLRIHNLDDGTAPGRGVVTIDVAGERVTVVQLADASAPVRPGLSAAPYQAWQALQPLPGVQLVHLLGSAHAVSVFGHAVAGRCAAVVGSLSHVATRDLRLVAGGTALVEDVGYVGPRGGIGGFDPEHFVATLDGRDPAELPPFRLVSGPTRISAVVVETRGISATGIEWLAPARRTARRPADDLLTTRAPGGRRRSR
jgi:hypothetical protein